MKIKELPYDSFADHQTKQEDKILGEDLAEVIGDLLLNFKDYNKLTSTEQWTRVAKALRIHGLKIIEGKDEC